MKRVRCLIADLPQQLLADIVQNMAEESGLIEVVDQVSSIADIPTVIASKPVDVLMLGMKNTELPSLCVDLMNRISGLHIIGLVDDGRRLAVYLNNVGRTDVLRIIRALPTLNRERTFENPRH